MLAPGETPIESPDENHAEFGRHITEEWDEELGRQLFVFHLSTKTTIGAWWSGLWLPWAAAVGK